MIYEGGMNRARIDGWDDYIQSLSDEEWKEMGWIISCNMHLKNLRIIHGALTDRRMSYLFRGLTKSTALTHLYLTYNVTITAAGVRSMEPFLHNNTNLRMLCTDGGNIQSEGFNILIRALRDSPIEQLQCNNCGIESIQIDTDYFPRQLKSLFLYGNKINVDGCRGIAELLHGGDSTLTNLSLTNNNVNDEGVAVLVDALQSNTSLQYMRLEANNGITKKGLVMLLKLVNDISSIKATLGSNHTLINIFVVERGGDESSEEEVEIEVEREREIQEQIDAATWINAISKGGNPEAAGAAGREKVIQTQLHSETRAVLAELQGVYHSLYSEINPLHLPEVLSLVGQRQGQAELFLALKSTIAQLISIVNRKEYIKQRRDYYLAKAEELTAELAEIEAAEGRVVDTGSDESRRKRSRKW